MMDMKPLLKLIRNEVDIARLLHEEKHHGENHKEILSKLSKEQKQIIEEMENGGKPPSIEKIIQQGKAKTENKEEKR